MAKTRIKTTPTRIQKEALMASAAVTTTPNIVTEHVFKKRISILKNAIIPKEKTVPIQSTIIVKSPKRTNSISSTTSTISYTSDGIYPCADSPPPPNTSSVATQNNGPTMDKLTENAIKTLNAGLVAKSNALALKNRKVYMITEKCDDAANGVHINSNGSKGENGTAARQKRKMYLIMEEKESGKNHGENAEKLIKTENTNGSKRLTLLTDTTNGQLPQKFEKILPEILNCIQAKKDRSVSALNDKTEILTSELSGQTIKTTAIQNDANFKLEVKPENMERLRLTLPPKKNRTKIITTEIIPVNSSQHAICPVNGIAKTGAVALSPFVVTSNNNGICKSQKSSDATPVVVNASSLLAANGHGNVTVNTLKCKENGSVINSKANGNQLHKNINLSTDFLFLMKMVPKLESIEDHYKNYVKTCIEDIINQYAPNRIDE